MKSIEEQVAADIAARSALGVKKYGFTVADNPLPLKAWLQHAYEESLDLPIYLKRAITQLEQKDKKRPSKDWESPCGCIKCLRDRKETRRSTLPDTLAGEV
jgi:hypothetical protein